MNPIDEKVKAVLEEAFSRYKAAEPKYGVPDFDKDPRDFLKEAEEELLDTINYAAFQIMRLRLRGEQWDKMVSNIARAVVATMMKEFAQGTIETARQYRHDPKCHQCLTQLEQGFLAIGKLYAVEEPTL